MIEDPCKCCYCENVITVPMVFEEYGNRHECTICPECGETYMTSSQMDAYYSDYRKCCKSRNSCEKSVN